MSDDIRRRMFHEMEQKFVFDEARNAAYSYADRALERNVFPTDAALAGLSNFDEDMPQTPGNALQILQKLHRYGSPATVAQTGGRYFGLVNGGVLPVTLAVRWLTDFWDQNTPLYLSSPLASRLEVITEAWLRDLFYLPDSCVAGYVSGSSMSILCGLAAARQRNFERLDWDINRRGFSGAPRLRVVASRQAHGTVSKAIALLGFGTDNVEWVDADEQGRIRTDLVPKLDASTILVLQAGNVNSGAFDDFNTLCPKATRVGAWVHIDGAFGLWAAGSRQLAHLTRGIEHADSWSFDGHKTLNTPYDSGVIICRHREALVKALHAAGAYIVYSEQRDGMLHTPEMSRRSRVVELWAALKYLGKSGIDELVYGLHERALQFAGELEQQGFEILNDVVFNQVLVACADDAQTTATIAAIQRSGICWVGGTQWQQRSVIRISVCSWVTTAEDISQSVRAFVDARELVLKSARQPAS
ncbi:MAG: aminotransferase class V-fold PLP-dependent enzyme [Gammaproteobacteria bacterium]|jgi:glutamate/tyrosine decarboxylase-like PLP-dependent enzyme|nr:aminotransferase class V-fold PLP-dependent enzyme [Gammaproteobacteria bacterium]